jgi:hypothetical protein
LTLEVRTDVPYGNAGEVSALEREGRTEVHFSADPHGGPECLWFCFRVEWHSHDGELASREVPPVDLVLEHVGNLLGGHEPQYMRPVVRYGSVQDPETAPWQRLGEGAVMEQPDGQVSVAWEIGPPPDLPGRPYADVAYCYPYGMPEVEALVQASGGYWRTDSIGLSQGGRALLRLSNDYGAAGGERPGLYLLARQHSGETPGSWVLDGFLRLVATLGDAAPLVWVVPLTNVDGVEGGDYGKDNYPYDLNRAWGRPPMRHEVLVLQADIRRWTERCRPALVLDMHAPGACETSGVYCYLPDPAVYSRFHQEALSWSTTIKGALTPQYAAECFERVARYASRWETPRCTGYCWSRHGVCGLGVETPYAMVGDLVLTREHYRQIGARMAEGVVRKLGL